ncbi:MAG TPA: VTT domain-containing protein [Thermoleophilaceae bacterium]|nr:VTT domain-containing protein [Thermoleophilaceae bacterium]
MLTPPAEEGTLEPPPLMGVLVAFAIVAVFAALVVAVEPLRVAAGHALSGDTEALRTELRDLGFWGGVLVIAICLSHAVVFYPAEVVDAAAGFVYGFWGGFALVMTGWMLNAIAAYWLGLHAGRPLLWRLIGRERFERYEQLVERGGTTLLLVMRLIPIVPFSVFSYAAGAARVRISTFMWTTAAGYMPLTVLFTYLGSRLDTLSLNDPVIWIGAVALVASLVLARRVVPAGR